MSNEESNSPLVTIDAAVLLVRERTGVPITKSRIHKDSARGIAPPPDAIYGRRYLWRPEKILAYAQSRAFTLGSASAALISLLQSPRSGHNLMDTIELPATFSAN
jgi:hypothetical protein